MSTIIIVVVMETERENRKGEIVLESKRDVELTEQGKLARAEYIKEWKRNHKDRVKQHNVNYWNRKAKELKDCERGEHDK